MNRANLIFVSGLILISVALCGSAPDCDDKNCRATNGEICFGRGTCNCGVCECDDTYGGPTCEDCPTCPDPCHVFKDCVGCKMFGTGTLSIMQCFSRCNYMGNFIEIDKKEFDTTMDDLLLCEYFNKGMCLESFKVGGMTDGYRDVFMRNSMNCTVPIPTSTTTLSVIDLGDIDADTSGGNQNSGYNSGEPEDAAAASGGDQRQPNGSSTIRASLSIVLLATLNVINKLVWTCWVWFRYIRTYFKESILFEWNQTVQFWFLFFLRIGEWEMCFSTCSLVVWCCFNVAFITHGIKSIPFTSNTCCFGVHVSCINTLIMCDWPWIYNKYINKCLRMYYSSIMSQPIHIKYNLITLVFWCLGLYLDLMFDNGN